MRVAITADLHYGAHAASDAAVRMLAGRMMERAPDVIVIAGDVAVADPRKLVAALCLFADSPARKLVIPGNHDLWSRDGGADSSAIWERLFSESARLGGFHRLDGAPIVVDGAGGSVGFVGSIGWYDYSFADGRLGVPRETYAGKELPGVARWNDGRFIRWRHDDEGFTRLAVDLLRRDLAAVSGRAQQIVAATHHVPFAELVVRRSHRGWMFADAFLGARALGETLLAEPKVRLAVSGHSRHGRAVEIARIHAATIGTTPAAKRALFYEIGSDGVRALPAEEASA